MKPEDMTGNSSGSSSNARGAGLSPDQLDEIEAGDLRFYSTDGAVGRLPSEVVRELVRGYRESQVDTVMRVARQRNEALDEVARLREEVTSLRQQVEHCSGPCADLTGGGAR